MCRDMGYTQWSKLENNIMIIHEDMSYGVQVCE